MAIVLLIAIVVILTVVGFRKRNAPLNNPPLHPSAAVLRLRESAS